MFGPVPRTVEVSEGSGPAERKDIDGERVGQPHPPLQSHTIGIRYVNTAISVIPPDHPTDNVGTSTAFQIVYRQLCIPARALNRALQWMESNRAGSLLRLL